jgi:glycosyltransferase involved in cell wall biosynthesis
MNKKFVCHLSSVHPAFDSRIFFKECKSLSEAGYYVSLIAVHDKEETVDGIEIIPFLKYKSRIKRILFSPFKMFSMAMKQQAYIYHFHDPELLIAGILLRVFAGAKVIYDIHEDYSKNFIDKPWIKFKVLRIAASKMYYFLEKIMCRLMSGNIVVLPHWVDKYPKAVLVRNYPLPEQLQEAKDENRFVYVGTIGSKRSAREMVEIFIELEKSIPGIKLDIIGVFTEKNLEAGILEYIKRCPAVSYLGYHPFNEAREVLAKAKYGFVLYADIKYKENIPAKMYEYLASEVIPIFSSFEDFKYDMEDEGWGIGVNPKKTLEAASKIYDIITNEEKKKNIEENMKRYKTRYGWESEKKQLLNLYKELSML